VDKVIPERESLTVEFKSDRDRLPDSELVAAVICLANTDGGDLYVGVEADGKVTGLHPTHANVAGLAAMIANRTVPPLSVRVEAIDVPTGRVARVSVPKARQLIATSEGLLQRRRLKANGEPECVPFYPHEFGQRHSDLGLLDYSALPVAESTPNDLDPVERARLRQVIQRYGGDASLLQLSDEELDGALGLIQRDAGKSSATVAGLLIAGKEASLRRLLPTHEVAFQDLAGTAVRVNEFYRAPLLRIFDKVMDHFASRRIEREMQVGLFRVPVPNFDQRAFREALINALVHRDYTRLGATHCRWETDQIVISNPGGFVEGVNLHNLLVVEPRPRNPLLADVMKRIGLAERTGRGVDLIYQGLLRFGRSAPDYTRSDSYTVTVVLPGGEADLGMLRLVIEQERKTNSSLPVDSLIALSRLRNERRLDTRQLAEAIQKDEARARAVLERLVEAGLVEAHGVKKGRTFTLASSVYRDMDDKEGYVRQVGFEPIQQEQMVLKYAKEHGKITRREAASLCQVSAGQASHLLRRLATEGKLQIEGERRGAHYRIP
jgi:ATP-dependent DNA helicase RecG